MAFTTAATTTEQDAELALDAKLGFRVPAGGSGAFTDIGPIDSVTPPKISVGKVESKRLSTRRKVYKPTRTDATMAFGVQHIVQDAAVATMISWLNSDAPIPIADWQITYASGRTEVFPGFLESYEPGDTDPDGIMTAKLAIQLCGFSTYANAASS